MDKELIIQRFKDTIAMLESLPAWKFDFSNWVTDSSVENECGSVCCTLGWYPKYFPESGLTWQKGFGVEDSERVSMVLMPLSVDRGHGTELIAAAAKWHGVSEAISQSIFLDSDYNFPLFKSIPVSEFKEEWESITIVTENNINISYARGSEEIDTKGVISMIELFIWLIEGYYIDREQSGTSNEQCGQN